MEARSLFKRAVFVLFFSYWMAWPGVLAGSKNSVIKPGQEEESWMKETPEQRDQRMAWWREARFGMFIHWGLYAIPAGVWKGESVQGIGEWIMHTAQIPVEEYEQLAMQFNPVRFNAKEWVQIAKEAGMKYIVITSKHHDGFSLFDSKLTDYDVVDGTPFKRDILKELSDECHKSGIRICWYHSILDWHHPDYLPRRKWDTRPAEGAGYNRYVDFLKGQLRELLTRYGKIGVLWFDGGWEHDPETHRAKEVVSMIKSLQPHIIINNRIRLPLDYDTPEQEIPATGIPGRDWETCMTMNDTWGYKVNDQNWKSSEDLLRKLVEIASKGGNFLLNVGPTAEGLIPQPSVERLREMGRWLRSNGESIYGTHASPFRRLPWGRCTQKAGKLYLHVFDWPEGGRLIVPGLRNEVEGAFLLADPEEALLSVLRAGEEEVIIQLPGKPPDPVDTVIVVKIKGPPEIAPWFERQREDGSALLKAFDATVHGQTARYESGGGKDNIGYWTNAEDYVTWDFMMIQAGEYSVEVTYAHPSGDSEYWVIVNGQELAGKVRSTGSWTNFVTERAGRVIITKPGKYTLAVKAKKIGTIALMNLKSVTLKPEK